MGAKVSCSPTLEFKNGKVEAILDRLTGKVDLGCEVVSVPLNGGQLGFSMQLQNVLSGSPPPIVASIEGSYTFSVDEAKLQEAAERVVTRRMTCTINVGSLGPSGKIEFVVDFDLHTSVAKSRPVQGWFGRAGTQGTVTVTVSGTATFKVRKEPEPDGVLSVAVLVLGGIAAAMAGVPQPNAA